MVEGEYNIVEYLDKVNNRVYNIVEYIWIKYGGGGKYHLA